MNILVTGGAGYVGSHVCKELARSGMTPITYDNLERGNNWAIQWGPFVEGNIQDKEKLKETFLKYEPVAIMHFAAYAYVGESTENPAIYYKNNLEGSLSLLDAAMGCGIENFIFSSSCATYGVPTTPLIGENHTQNPINPYGKSKLMVEHILQDYGKSYNLNYAILRYFNAAGADREGDIGEHHTPETHLIPLAIKAAMGNASILSIFGGDYDTPDGTCIRDYIHVTDLASAHVAALKNIIRDGSSFVLNLGTENGTSVFEILNTIKEVTGLAVPLQMQKRRAGDPPMLVASASQANSVLNWKPGHSEITNIIETAYNWELARH